MLCYVMLAASHPCAKCVGGEILTNQRHGGAYNPRGEWSRYNSFKAGPATSGALLSPFPFGESRDETSCDRLRSDLCRNYSISDGCRWLQHVSLKWLLARPSRLTVPHDMRQILHQPALGIDIDFLKRKAAEGLIRSRIGGLASERKESVCKYWP